MHFRSLRPELVQHAQQNKLLGLAWGTQGARGQQSTKHLIELSMYFKLYAYSCLLGSFLQVAGVP